MPLTSKYFIVGAVCYLVILNGVHSFCVSQDNGNNSASSWEYENEACCTLKSLIPYLEAMENTCNIHIYITQNITLDSIISIASFENVTIQSEKEFEIQCKNDAGIYFENVTGLVLINLTIESCGMLQKSSTLSKGQYQLAWYAVYVLNSTNLSIIDVTISHSRGAGTS